MMKEGFCPVLVFLLALISHSGGARAGSAIQESARMETVLLPNSSPLVSFRILFSVGSALDPAGKEGIAALTAALVSGGGTRRHSYSEIIEAMYPMATSFTAQVDKEMTVFYGTTHRDNLERYFSLISEILLEPGWREEDFKRVKSDATNFLKVNLSGTNDEELAKEELYKFIYLGHPYGHEGHGRLSSLERLTLEDLKSFYKNYYTRANLVLGLAGGYTAQFLAEAKRRFESLPAGGPAGLTLPEAPAIKGLNVEIIEKETRATAISLGFPIGVRRGHKDWVALYLVQSFFGQHRSSSAHLYQRLRELRGLNYGDYAYIEYFPRGMFQIHPDPNLARRHQVFQIWIRPVEPQNSHFALRAALYELDKLVRSGMKARDFEVTRNFLSKQVNVLTKTQDLELGYRLDSRSYGITTFAEYVKNGLAGLTLADINRVVRENLQAKNVKIVMVAKDAAPLKEALISDAPSPIQYNASKPRELLEEDEVIANYTLKIPRDAVRIIPGGEVFR